MSDENRVVVPTGGGFGAVRVCAQLWNADIGAELLAEVNPKPQKRTPFDWIFVACLIASAAQN